MIFLIHTKCLIITISLFYILLLLKGVYAYEYMDEWEKLFETLLLAKEDFYSRLNKSLRYTTDTYYTVTKRICKDFEINSLGEYHDLYVQSDTLLLADVLDICALKYMNLILQNFFQLQD